MKLSKSFSDNENISGECPICLLFRFHFRFHPQFSAFFPHSKNYRVQKLGLCWVGLEPNRDKSSQACYPLVPKFLLNKKFPLDQKINKTVLDQFHDNSIQL
jgi:hypothetical protein